MAVDKHAVKKIARLARLQISEEKSELLSADLGNILNWIEQLEEVDTTGIEPLASVNEHSLPWRQDLVTDGKTHHTPPFGMLISISMMLVVLMDQDTSHNQSKHLLIEDLLGKCGITS